MVFKDIISKSESEIASVRSRNESPSCFAGGFERGTLGFDERVLLRDEMRSESESEVSSMSACTRETVRDSGHSILCEDDGFDVAEVSADGPAYGKEHD